MTQTISYKLAQKTQHSVQASEGVRIVPISKPDSAQPLPRKSSSLPSDGSFSNVAAPAASNAYPLVFRDSFPLRNWRWRPGR